MVIRAKKNKNYTVINNTVLKDASLSLKAKGLMCVVLSLPDTWNFSITGICGILKEGRDAVYAIIDELEAHGYVVKRQLRLRGKFAQYEYVFNEVPHTEVPHTEVPHTEVPHTETPTQLSTNKLNTNESITNKIKTLSLAREKFFEKKENNNFDPPPRVAPHPPPSKEEVIEYFESKIPTGSDTPERFYNIMSAHNWTYKGSVVYDWRLIADNWIGMERSQQKAKNYERPNKDEQRYQRIARHIQRYNDAVAKRAAGNSKP